MKTTLALCLLILLASACAPKGYTPFNLVPPSETPPSSSSGTSSGVLPASGSGIRGQVLIGPSCPVVQVASPCPDKPYQASFTVLRLDGQEVTRFETDAQGKFEVALPPGDYILHPEVPAGKMIPTAADVPFTVNPGEFTELIVSFDSGIR